MLLFFCSLIISSFAEENLLWSLNPENIEAALKYQPRMLILFWSSSDESSRKVFSQARQAAEKLNSHLIRIGLIDCSSYASLCSSHSVDTTPHFLYFDNESTYNYTGGPSGEEISKWVLPRFKYSLDYLKETEDILTLFSNNRVSFLYLGENEEILKIMKDLSVHFINIKFYISKHEDTREVLACDSKFVLSRGNELTFYNGEADFSSLFDFLTKNKPNELHEFNEEVIKTIFEKKNPAFFLFCKTLDKGKYLKDFGKLADRYESRFIFVMTDLSTKGKNHNKLAHALGLNIDIQPLAVILNIKETYFKYRSASLNYESLVQFVNDYFEGKLLPFYKSQAVESESFENNVMNVVGLNHEEVTQDKTKDVLAFYYTAQHPESTSFAPVFEKLALNYLAFPDMLLVKMDIVYNEAKGLLIPHLPLVKYYPRHDKNGIVYSGDLTLFGLQKFVSAHYKKEEL
jgi:hypothetical protein